MNSKERKYDLEERLIKFAVNLSSYIENLPSTKLNNHIVNQAIRSGTSPALNYGEAQGAESTKDFIHKCRIILKELRETFVSLRILEEGNKITSDKKFEALKKENSELIAIFATSIKTASRNKNAAHVDN